VNPMVAVALGWWLLGERVDTRVIAASAVIVAAVALIALGVRRPAEPAERPAPSPAISRSRRV
jgi:drug/metabolite transporter (DMT)-like permease